MILELMICVHSTRLYCKTVQQTEKKNHVGVFQNYSSFCMFIQVYSILYTVYSKGIIYYNMVTLGLIAHVEPSTGLWCTHGSQQK